MKDSGKCWLIATNLLLSQLMFLTASSVCADTYEYDDLNRMTKIIYENGDYIEYEYDAAGNITKVHSPDIPPVAEDDAATFTEDDHATTINVLDNDTDVDGGPKGIGSVTQPANGTVTITNSGADLTYMPAPDYCNDGVATDNFTYTLTPGGSTATVRMTVTCVNDPICGDLDSDGDVDGDDRNILRSALNSRTGDAGFILEADYDGDGLISYNDYRAWYACYKAFIEH